MWWSRWRWSQRSSTARWSASGVATTTRCCWSTSAMPLPYLERLSLGGDAPALATVSDARVQRPSHVVALQHLVPS
ncbi:unnamed protein product [Lampetra fluviatilis]